MILVLDKTSLSLPHDDVRGCTIAGRVCDALVAEGPHIDAAQKMFASTERTLQLLIRSGAIAVDRNGKGFDDQSRHGLIMVDRGTARDALKGVPYIQKLQGTGGSSSLPPNLDAIS